MESLSLYNITNKFIELFEKSENEELTQEELQEQGNELAVALRNKSTNIIGYMKNLDATSEALKSEIERLTAIKKSIDSKKDKFTEYVKNNMEMLQLEKVETPIGNLTIAKNPMSVEIVDEIAVPDEYKVAKVTTSVDKKAILSHFKETGELIPGTNVITNKTNLRIK